MKHQALFSSKDKSKKLKCRLLQFLFGALMVNYNYCIHTCNTLLKHSVYLRQLHTILTNTKAPVKETILVLILTHFFGISYARVRAILHQYRMDGWMTCDFTSFLTVFQSYQDDVWMIMKGCVQWNSVYG